MALSILDPPCTKSKNFAWLIWGGSLFVIAGPLGEAVVNHQVLILTTMIIPILFWIMDYQWRKHLRYASERQKMVSIFINSDKFLEELSDQGVSVFPLLDPVGWIYIIKKEDEKEKNLKGIPGMMEELAKEMDQKYFIDRKQYGFWRIAFYKDAGYYFLTMIAISFVFGDSIVM